MAMRLALLALRIRALTVKFVLGFFVSGRVEIGSMVA